MDDDLDFQRLQLKSALSKAQDQRAKCPEGSKQYDYYDTMCDMFQALDYSCQCWNNYARMYRLVNNRLVVMESVVANLLNMMTEQKSSQINQTCSYGQPQKEK